MKARCFSVAGLADLCHVAALVVLLWSHWGHVPAGLGYALLLAAVLLQLLPAGPTLHRLAELCQFGGEAILLWCHRHHAVEATGYALALIGLLLHLRSRR